MDEQRREALKDLATHLGNAILHKIASEEKVHDILGKKDEIYRIKPSHVREKDEWLKEEEQAWRIGYELTGFALYHVILQGIRIFKEGRHPEEERDYLTGALGFKIKEALEDYEGKPDIQPTTKGWRQKRLAARKEGALNITGRCEVYAAKERKEIGGSISLFASRLVLIINPSMGLYLKGVFEEITAVQILKECKEETERALAARVERALHDEDDEQLMEAVSQVWLDLWERYRDKSRYPDPEQYQRMMEREQRARDKSRVGQDGDEIFSNCDFEFAQDLLAQAFAGGVFPEDLVRLLDSYTHSPCRETAIALIKFNNEFQKFFVGNKTTLESMMRTRGLNREELSKTLRKNAALLHQEPEFEAYCEAFLEDDPIAIQKEKEAALIKKGYTKEMISKAFSEYMSEF